MIRNIASLYILSAGTSSNKLETGAGVIPIYRRGDVAVTHAQIGNRIKKLRISEGYSRDAFAEKLGMSIKFVYEIETGKKGFSVDTLLKISKLLSVSCDYILDNDTSKMLTFDHHQHKGNQQISEIAYMKKITRLLNEMNQTKQK